MPSKNSKIKVALSKFKKYFCPVNSESLSCIKVYIDEKFFTKLKNDYYLFYFEKNSGQQPTLVFIDKNNKKIVVFVEWNTQMVVNIYDCCRGPTPLDRSYIEATNTEQQITNGLKFFNLLVRRDHINIGYYEGTDLKEKNPHKDMLAILERDVIKNEIGKITPKRKKSPP